jgi:4-hydroxy-4-methyl-2-oxoglutarate aldolase
MMDAASFARLATTTYCDVLTRDRVMDMGMRPLWAQIPRIAGPAYPVRNEPADNFMLHIAIHRAPPGSVIVCQAGDNDYAQAGGNVCAWAQKRGVAGLVVDGVLRDVGESRDNRFPLFGRGIIPIPAKRTKTGVLNGPVSCGGAAVSTGDMVIADEEGILVLHSGKAGEIVKAAQARAEKEASTSLEDWVAAHKKTIDELVTKLGIDA